MRYKVQLNEAHALGIQVAQIQEDLIKIFNAYKMEHICTFDITGVDTSGAYDIAAESVGEFEFSCVEHDLIAAGVVIGYLAAQGFLIEDYTLSGRSS